MTEIKGACPHHGTNTNGSGNSLRKRKKKVLGVGINDADYLTQSRHSGKCPYYETWSAMLTRCFSEDWKEKHPSYLGVTACEEWLTFSNFKAWMETQDWEGKQLDKDLLGDGKLYSPETCCFLERRVNSFITSHSTRGGEGLPVGVYKSKKRFQALCRNPLGEKPYIGTYRCETKAHFEYLKKKQSYARKLSDMEHDQRIKKAILERFSCGN